MMKLSALALASTLTLAGVADSASADPVADFYAGKRLSIYVGSSVGGLTDGYGRLVAQFIGNHIPGNPTGTVINQPGANGLVVANNLARTLPKDGTAIGTFDRNAALHSIWGNPAAKFSAQDLNWIGSANIDTSTCVTWHTTGIDTLEKFITQPVVLGSASVYHANLLNSLFGAKLRQVTGYQGGNDINLALERGEVQGRCNWSWSSIIGTRPHWVRDKKINIIVQFAEEKHPELPDVPLVTELAKTPEQRQMLDLILTSQTMARPFAVPPGVPEERVAALRNAFIALEKDPAFVAAAEAQQIELSLVDGERIQASVARVAAAPKDVIRKLRDVVLGAQASAEMERAK